MISIGYVLYLVLAQPLLIELYDSEHTNPFYCKEEYHEENNDDRWNFAFDRSDGLPSVCTWTRVEWRM